MISVLTCLLHALLCMLPFVTTDLARKYYNYATDDLCSTGVGQGLAKEGDHVQNRYY